jgi:HAD superfamily hydrolase (TIGR01459 family)
MMREISGLRDIALNFDAMLIDQFGVLHDGQKLYPGAATVMQQLKDHKIPVVIMTNSGKRAATNIDRVVKMGIPRNQFVGCVSSGEVAFHLLQVRRAFLIGKHNEDYGFDPIELVDDPKNAEVMLILGSNAPATSLEDYQRVFTGMNLPAVCCNPDKLMITRDGLQPAPGAIAELYEAMGGKVTWIGKPYADIYRFALTQLGNPQRVLCIGDSAEHDVAGGRNAGLHTLLLLQGISAGAEVATLSPAPDFVMPDFKW